MRRYPNLEHELYHITSRQGSENHVEQAVVGQVEFPAAYLPNPNELGIVVTKLDTHTSYARERNDLGLNVNYLDSDLLVTTADIISERLRPKRIQWQTRCPLMDSRGAFFGYTNAEYTYWQPQEGDLGAALMEQRVWISRMDTKEINNLAIVNRVQEHKPEQTFATVIFSSHEQARKLGFPSTDLRAIGLDLLPSVVLVSIGNHIIGELDYSELGNILGIQASFVDEPSLATLILKNQDIAYHLVLGKKLAENYVQRMFDPTEPWLTESHIKVTQTPVELLN